MLTKEEFEKNFYESELFEEAEEGDKLVWIPEAKNSQNGCRRNILIRFSEGSGCNLDEDDIEAGFDSYVNFDIESCYNVDQAFRDGGMEMYKSDENSFEETCEDIIKEWFGDVETIEEIEI